MKKIIIFGGYGFIGSHLYKNLKKKYSVIRYSSFNKNKNFVKYNYKNFSKIFKDFKPDIVFFLSGTTMPDYFDKYHLKDLNKTNYVLQNLLFSLSKINFQGKFFFFSTIGVYGTNNSYSAKESSSTNPESFYTLSKVIAERQCKFFSSRFNMNINVLRICSIFGPGLKKQIIYKIIKSTLSKKKNIELLGSKNDKREFLFINDLIYLLNKIMKSSIKKKLINVGSGKQYKIGDIVKKILNIQNIKKKVIFRNTIKAPRLPLLNNSEVKKLIKIKYEFSIESGLKETFNYVKKND